MSDIFSSWDKFLPVWGAALSTFLFTIKIWETIRDRGRIVTSYHFDSRPEVGNTIELLNPSKLPVIIAHYELFRSKAPIFRRRFFLDARYPDDGLLNVTIAAHSKHTLKFCYDLHFGWNDASSKKGNLYIKLHIAGAMWPKVLLVN